jgi:hypothetical protein
MTGWGCFWPHNGNVSALWTSEGRAVFGLSPSERHGERPAIQDARSSRTVTMSIRTLLIAGLLTLLAGPAVADSRGFDHAYTGYGAVLVQHVSGDRVDYAKLKANRAALDRVVDEFGTVTREQEAAWSRPQRMAYWINAYNLFTLRAIVDHYPIQGSWFSFYPKNSIRQIDGVWTGLQWNAGGRRITLDDLEHKLLRPEFQDPRVHFAVNCASLGCPPLATEPYRAPTLEAQLDAAAVRYLKSPRGLVVEGGTLRLSSIFKWFGGDFEARFAAAGPAGRSATDRALLGVVAAYGPAPAQALARNAQTRIAFLDYDWSLNDTTAR